MNLPATSQAFLRILKLRCPECGEGHLFQSYLRVVPICANCQSTLGTIRADDGPTWLAILITGHLIVPLLVHVGRNEDWPGYYVLPGFLLLTVVVVLSVLPYCKSAFISVLWRLQQKKVVKANLPDQQ